MAPVATQPRTLQAGALCAGRPSAPQQPRCVCGFRAPAPSTSQPAAARAFGAFRALSAGKQRSSTAVRSLTYGEVNESVSRDSYMTLGLSRCFEKDEDGKLVERLMIEPLAANMVECMVTGAETSFVHVYGLALGQALAKDKGQLPAEFAQGLWCEDFEFRAECAARTWLRSHAQDNLLDLVPLGKLRSNFNTSTDKKRVLNFENVVDDSDNIKQDMSIDVYGRKGSDEDSAPAGAKPAADAKPAAKADEEEEEDELDSLLAA